MNLANKSYRNNQTGEVIKVIDSFENIAILENKKRVDVRSLLDSSQFTEQIDVTNFFNNQGAYNQLAEKIKSIPIDNIIDDDRGNTVRADGISLPSSVSLPPVTESAVIMTTEEDEKAELARKYGATMDSQRSLESQNQAFAKILGEGAEDELPKIDRPVQVAVNGEPQPISYQQPQRRQDDPITSMFRNVKRNVNFKVNIEILNKIPRIDFIEMMEDSYEVSIIDFLAEEFTQNILSDPRKLKESIKDKINLMVYGAIKSDIVESTSKSKKTSKPVVKKPKPPKSQVIKEGKDPIPAPPNPPSDRLIKEGGEPPKPRSLS